MSFSLTGGNFQLAGGGAVANGSVRLTLSNNTAIVIATGAAAPTSYIFNLDASGNFVSGSQAFGNAELSPPGTFYTAQVFNAPNATGTLVSNFTWIIGPSAPYTGTLFPNVTVLPPISVAGSVTGSFTITGNSGLPAATTANLYLGGTFGSPILGKIYVGDGTGWQFDFAKRTGSSDIDLFAFKDSGVGVFTATGVLAFGSSGLATPDVGVSRSAAGVLAIGNGTQGNVNATVKVAAISLPTAANTLPATIQNDTAGGVNVTTNGGKVWEFANGGSLSSPAGSGVQFNGATSGAIAIVAPAVAGSNVLTLPAATDQLVGRATVDNLINKNLLLAGSGNLVTLLDRQGPASAIVGTAADATVYTFSIPANTIGSGKGICVTVGCSHSTGTAAVTYKLKLGATTVFTMAHTDSATTNIQMESEIFNLSGVQNSQFARVIMFEGLGLAENAFATSAENTVNALSIAFTFNVANTDQVTPKFWLVELIQ